MRIIGTILGFYGDTGKENGNYYIRVIYPGCRIIIGIQTGTIILTTIQMHDGHVGFGGSGFWGLRALGSRV